MKIYTNKKYASLINDAFTKGQEEGFREGVNSPQFRNNLSNEYLKIDADIKRLKFTNDVLESAVNSLNLAIKAIANKTN